MDRIQLGSRSSVTTVVIVSPGEILAVVAGEIQVVKGVVSWRVDVGFEEMTGDHVAVVNLLSEWSERSRDMLMGPS